MLFRSKHECPMYLKSIGKSKALATTLSDTEPEDDSDNEDDGILNAFTATVDPTDGIVEEVIEEEKLVESKFEKMDDQDDIHTAYEKLYKLSEKHEELYRLTTRISVMWNLIVRSFPQSLMKLIRLLKHRGSRTISWLRRPRSLKQNWFKLELNWRGLQVQSLMICSAYRNLLQIEQV